MKVGKSIKPVLGFIGGLLIAMSFILIIGSIVYFSIQGSAGITTLDNETDANTVVVSIKEGSTTSVFNNDLFITVDEVHTFTASTGVFTRGVSFIVGAVGYDNLVTESADIGQVITYKTDIQYFIRVGSLSEGFSKDYADFVVTKKEELSP